MAISERAKKANPSPTLAITARAKQMKAEGIDVVSFGAGEPDFDTPDNIKEACIEAIRAGLTKYTPSSGTPELKQAICEKFKKENGLEYEPANIAVSIGAKHSIYNTIMALCDPGDEVIIPTPYWVTYSEQVKLAEGVSVFVHTDESTDFVTTAEQIAEYITPKTKILILNSPCNPTGAVYDPDEIKRIAELAVEKQFYVISDEIYEHLIYDGKKHVSTASFGPEIKKLTVTVNGVSKTYSMTGWRVGYLAAEKEIAAAIGRIQDHSTTNPVTFVQKATIEALRGPQNTVREMAREFDRRRKYMVERLNSIPGIRCAVPRGAFYAFPNISQLFGKKGRGKEIIRSDSFADYLLETARVAVVPGSGFGADTNIRLSYATSMEAIEKGLDRIEEAVAELA